MRRISETMGEEELKGSTAESMEESSDARLVRLIDLLEMRVKQVQSPWLALRNGLLAGVGGVVGATLVVAVLTAVLKPFDKLQVIGPALERLSRQMDEHREP